MNKIIQILFIIISIGAIQSKAQTPNFFRYQAALQDVNGDPMAVKAITFRISILRSEDKKERVYSEFQSVKTDEFGMVNLMIGKGNVISGKFDLIDWGAGDHFLKIEMDENGSSQFKLLSDVQLLSVPYALYAKNVENTDDADADPENEIQTLSLVDNQLSISGSNVVTLPANNDNDSENELQTLTLTGNDLSISGGNTITLSSNSVTQTLTLTGNQLSISGGNSVMLPPSGGAGTIPDPSQPVPISFRGNVIYIHPTDNANAIIFGAFADSGANSDFDGEANSAAIVTALGAANYAAQVCDELEAFGFDDWYLPSRAELDAIYKQNYLLSDYELSGYWSSTETANNKAWAIDFLNGSLSDDTKNQVRNCRCVRKE